MVMTDSSSPGFVSAREDFHRARRRAVLEGLLARLTGRSAELLSYEQVRQQLGALEGPARGLQDIPLTAIVGSVGRYDEFTRSFLPRRPSDEQRWAAVKTAVLDSGGVPPIDVYQIGQAYFVRDGHHRVSIARQLGATHIQAYVTEVHAKVPLPPDAGPDDVILLAEYAEFLERTRLDVLRPGADLRVTSPGQHQAIAEHIAVHRYFMGLEQRREIPYEEAVTHWYDEVYLPLVQVIREQGILRYFPGRTETDLYVWISSHHAALKEELGWDLKPTATAADLAAQFSPRPQRVVARAAERILDAMIPDEFQAGPAPGQWRREQLAAQRDDCLFADILVAIDGEEAGWWALEQALAMARCEEARLHGLHVVPSATHRGGEAAQALQAEFSRRCAVGGVPGRLAIAAGDVAHTICERARWTDLVVLSLNYPPAPQPIARLGSGLSAIIRRCPRPLLIAPGAAFPLERVLLAYDGSPKAEEALFVTTYLASRRQLSPVVVTVIEAGRTTSATLARAREYLAAHGVPGTFVAESGSVAAAILKVAQERESDLLVMGGYGLTPVLEVVLGSAVDEVLRASRRPVLICR